MRKVDSNKVGDLPQVPTRGPQPNTGDAALQRLGAEAPAAAPTAVGSDSLDLDFDDPARRNPPQRPSPQRPWPSLPGLDEITGAGEEESRRKPIERPSPQRPWPQLPGLEEITEKPAPAPAEENRRKPVDRPRPQRPAPRSAGSSRAKKAD